MENQLRRKIEYVNIEARNTFYEGVSAAKLKYIAGFNHHRTQNFIINKGLTKKECL